MFECKFKVLPYFHNVKNISAATDANAKDMKVMNETGLCDAELASCPPSTTRHV